MSLGPPAKALNAVLGPAGSAHCRLHPQGPAGATRRRVLGGLAGAAAAWAGAPAWVLAGTDEPPLRWPGRGQATLRGRLRYAGLSLGLRGQLSWDFDLSSTTYTLGLEAWTGLGVFKELVQTSTGRIGPQGLLPQRFGDRRLRRTERVTTFESLPAGGRRVRFPRGQTQDLASIGVQDRLSVLFQVAALARARPAGFQPGLTQTVPTAGSSRVSDWVFEVSEPDRMEWAGKPVTALHLVRQPRDEDDARLELWLLPALEYLPVRSRATEGPDDVIEYEIVDVVR